MNDIDLIKYFISKSPQFWSEDNFTEIDPKHKNVLKSFSDEFDYEKFLNEIRSWKMQDDGPIPFQATFYHLKKKGLHRFFFDYLRYLLSKIKKYDLSISLLDDVDILKSVGAYEILQQNPVHLTPYSNNFYFLSKEISTNYRWNKYIYYANAILKKKIFESDQIWIDIGSYYGGLQGIIARYFKSYKIILVDFHHQLCRSYLYLNKLYPESVHIIGEEIEDINHTLNKSDKTFIYLSINNLDKIKSIKPFLTTNMFSFGEMTENTFEDYFNSDYLNKSKYLYLVNRFVSSPFFENTYKNNINIFNYQNKNFSKLYFDIFPINHYQTPYRKLFGRSAPRPTSSSYFEIIYKNNF